MIFLSKKLIFRKKSTKSDGKVNRKKMIVVKVGRKKGGG